MAAKKDKKSLQEADIRRIYIDPAIECKWNPEQIRSEYFFTDGRVIVSGKNTSRGKRKRADYLLSWLDNQPLAVVEAKDNKHSPGAGLQQAIEYAEILDVPFAYSSNGDAFVEHDLLAGKQRELTLAEFPTPQELWQRFRKSRDISDELEKIITFPYHYDYNAENIKSPRYYQRIAINRAVEAVSRGQKRVLLAMATGTGKTYTAFQIAWRLWKSGQKKKILYLADRNVLVDQAMEQDFKPFEKCWHKIQHQHLDSAYEIYFSLYHQLAGDEGQEPFREFQPGFFDLVLIDECHRGSAKDESAWRRILDYFSEAAHIGMTATPKETRDTSSSAYFGEPIYVYSLKQGIEDGFLAPYKVVRVWLDRDVSGWRPEAGKLDIHGQPVPDRQYILNDYERKVVIDERTKKVAERITRFLGENDRYAKTIVFCEDTEHADRLRQKLVNLNSDLVRENPRYIVRITCDEANKERDLENFIDPASRYPVIVTTSELLSTGVDCKTCKLIVLDKNIASDIEFKQIIGRGTRLREDYDKLYFTIMDFRGITRLFTHDDFWVVPEQDENFEPGRSSNGGTGAGGGREKIYVDEVPVQLVMEMTQEYGIGGKLITENLVDYSRKNILGEYARLDDFLKAWNSQRRKAAILEELREHDVRLDAVREKLGGKDMDDFDLICHLAYDQKPLTRSERARKVKNGAFLNSYQGLAREVLAALLDKYAQFGIGELAGTEILTMEPFRKWGSVSGILEKFGGREEFLRALAELQAEIYAAAS